MYIDVPDPEKLVQDNTNGEEDGADLSDDDEPNCCTRAVRGVTKSISQW